VGNERKSDEEIVDVYGACTRRNWALEIRRAMRRLSAVVASWRLNERINAVIVPRALKTARPSQSYSNTELRYFTSGAVGRA
jgi:hypothetical protein